MDLTAEQIAHFHDEGWPFLPELFTPEEVALLRREAEAVYNENRPEIWREKNGARDHQQQFSSMPRAAHQHRHRGRAGGGAGQASPAVHSA